MQVTYTGITFYIISFVFSLFFMKLSELELNREKLYSNAIFFNKSIFFLFLSCCTLWGVAAIRGHVGLDYDSYSYKIGLITDWEKIFLYEPGFGALSLFVNKLGLDFHALMFVMSLGTGIFLWISIYRDAKNFSLSLLGVFAVNYYFMSFSVIRQFFAISIVLLSVPYIVKRKFIKFLLVVFAACLFHYTAIIFILLYFLVPRKIGKVFTYKNLIVTLVLLIGLAYLENLLNAILPIVGNFKENYSGYTLDSNSEKSFRSVIFIMPIILFAFYYNKKLVQCNKTNVVYIWMSFLLFLTSCIGVISPSFSRFHYYFSFSIVILFSYLSSLFKGGLLLLNVILVLIYYFWSIYNVFQYQWNDFLPYHTMWDI